MPDTATVQIAMPEMGESVTEGIVLEWHVAVGDFVNEGDTVVEVSTDKVDAEVPAPVSGTVTKLLVEVDDEVPVGAPMLEMEAGEARRRRRDELLRPRVLPPTRAPSSSQAAGEDTPSAPPAGGNGRRTPRSTAAERLRATGPTSRPRRSLGGWPRRKGSTWARSRPPASAARSPRRTCSTAATAPATARAAAADRRRGEAAARARGDARQGDGREPRGADRDLASGRSPSTPSTRSARRSTRSSKSAA